MKILANIVLFALVASNALAYSPPASFILSQSMKPREKLKTLEIDGQVTGSSLGQTVREVLNINFNNGAIMARYFDESGITLGVASGKISNLRPLGRAWIGIAMDPFLNRVRNTLESMGSLPLENTEVKIDRVGSKTVWHWGEAGKLKFLKDEFLFAGYSSANLSIEVKDYTAKNGAIVLPKTVVVKDGAFTYSLKSFKMNSAFPQGGLAVIVSQAGLREWVELVR